MKTNWRKIMNKKYQIFISSTYTDLVEERKYVQDVILSMNHFPVGMELFSAASEEQWNIIKRTIDTSDFYVLIIGYRYGSEMPDGIGYTEREYMYAKEKGVPVIVFIKQEGLPVKETDREASTSKKKKLKDFINRAKMGREVSWWSTKEELGQKVTVSLYKEFERVKRPGWVRATEVLEKSKMEELQRTIMQLRSENEELKRELSKKKVGVRESLFKSTDFLKMKNSGKNPCDSLSDMHFIDYFDD